jgi:hypothetical protein
MSPYAERSGSSTSSLEVTSTGSTCSVRKIGSQSLAAATPAPVTSTTALSAATTGRRSAGRQRPRVAPATAGRPAGAVAAVVVAKRFQAASVSTGTDVASAASTSRASARVVSSARRQVGQLATWARSSSVTPAGSSTSRRRTPSLG